MISRVSSEFRKAYKLFASSKQIVLIRAPEGTCNGELTFL